MGMASGGVAAAGSGGLYHFDDAVAAAGSTILVMLWERRARRLLAMQDRIFGLYPARLPDRHSLHLARAQTPFSVGDRLRRCAIYRRQGRRLFWFARTYRHGHGVWQVPGR